MKLPSLAILAASLCASQALAVDTLSFSFTNPVQIGSPSSVLSFVGVATAPGTNAAPIYLNGDSFSLPGPFAVNDTPFFLNFPVLLSPGQTVTATALTVSVSASPTPSTYNGTFTVLGGSSSTASSSLATANFQIIVAGAAVPETGATLILFAAALAAVSALSRFTRKM